MRTYLMTATVLAGLAGAGAAFASDDCRVPQAEWQSRDAVAAMATKQGWTDARIETDDGCYEIDARDAQGREVEAKVHPGTLEIIKLKYGDGDCRVPMENWQPREAVQKMAETKGWTVRRIQTDDGCYEIKARDAENREIEVKVDPATLDMVEFEYEDDGYRAPGATTGAMELPANGSSAAE
ncbi:MAG TPA: PepSY domain-containing protein [Roseovarius sp.]